MVIGIISVLSIEIVFSANKIGLEQMSWSIEDRGLSQVLLWKDKRYTSYGRVENRMVGRHFGFIDGDKYRSTRVYICTGQETRDFLIVLDSTLMGSYSLYKNEALEIIPERFKAMSWEFASSEDEYFESESLYIKRKVIVEEAVDNYEKASGVSVDEAIEQAYQNGVRRDVVTPSLVKTMMYIAKIHDFSDEADPMGIGSRWNRMFDEETLQMEPEERIGYGMKVLDVIMQDNEFKEESLYKMIGIFFTGQVTEEFKKDFDDYYYVMLPRIDRAFHGYVLETNKKSLLIERSSENSKVRLNEPIEVDLSNAELIDRYDRTIEVSSIEVGSRVSVLYYREIISGSPARISECFELKVLD
jgi:hypothetical protein